MKLAITALSDTPTMNKLSGYFWRDYHRGEQIGWLGQEDREDLNRLIRPREFGLESAYCRFQKNDWLDISELSFALGAPDLNFRSPYSLVKVSYLWL